MEDCCGRAVLCVLLCGCSTLVQRTAVEGLYSVCFCVVVAPFHHRAAASGIQSFDDCSWGTLKDSHNFEHKRQLTG